MREFLLARFGMAWQGRPALAAAHKPLQTGVFADSDLPPLKFRKDIAPALPRTGRSTGTQDAPMPTPGLIRNDLRLALQRDELRLLYQPQVNLRSGQVSCVEALLRWQHPDGRLMLPSEFIHIAEESGLIHELGAWVLREAGRQWCDWRRAGQPACCIAVNVSARQLSSPSFLRCVREALPAEALACGALQVELTESYRVAQEGQEIQHLRALVEMGVQLALDDFGTGYANFSMLRFLPLDCIKLDQSLIAGLSDSPRGSAVVATVIHMAHELRLRVIAEGVETQAQCDILLALGCDEVQGYLFAQPVTAEALQSLLAGWRGHSSSQKIRG